MVDQKIKEINSHILKLEEMKNSLILLENQGVDDIIESIDERLRDLRRLIEKN